MAFDYRTEYHRYRQYYINLRNFYQQPTIKVSFFVLLSFFTVVFFAVFAIRPTVVTIGQLIKSIDDKRKVDMALAKKINALDELQVEMVGIRDDIDKIFTVLPEDSDLGRLMQIFEYIAKENNINLISVRFQPVRLGEENKIGSEERVVNFSLSAGGSLAEVIEFMQDLEEVDRLLVLDKMRFLGTGVSAGRIGSEVAIEVSGRSFFLRERKVAGEEWNGWGEAG